MFKNKRSTFIYSFGENIRDWRIPLTRCVFYYQRHAIILVVSGAAVMAETKPSTTVP